MSYWEVHLEYWDGDEAEGRKARSTSLVFESDRKASALADLVRFWGSRRKNAPEFFGPLLACKFGPYTIQTIDEGGSLRGGRALFGLEWKCDTAGCSFETWAALEATRS